MKESYGDLRSHSIANEYMLLHAWKARMRRQTPHLWVYLFAWINGFAYQAWILTQQSPSFSKSMVNALDGSTSMVRYSIHWNVTRPSTLTVLCDPFCFAMGHRRNGWDNRMPCYLYVPYFGLQWSQCRQRKVIRRRTTRGPSDAQVSDQFWFQYDVGVSFVWHIYRHDGGTSVCRRRVYTLCTIETCIRYIAHSLHS